MTNRLKYHFCYLAGPMDNAEDGGTQWRDDITPFLRNMGVIILNPCDKPIDVGIESTEDRCRRAKLKKMGKYDKLSKEMKQIRNVDLRMVDKSDFIIVNIDWDIRMCGTREEIALANRQKKPILVRCKQGKKEMSDWDFAKLRHEMFFNTWGELRTYINHIDQDAQVEHLNRWFFFNLDEQIEETAEKMRLENEKFLTLVEDVVELVEQASNCPSNLEE